MRVSFTRILFFWIISTYFNVLYYFYPTRMIELCSKMPKSFFAPTPPQTVHFSLWKQQTVPKRFLCRAAPLRRFIIINTVPLLERSCPNKVLQSDRFCARRHAVCRPMLAGRKSSSTVRIRVSRGRLRGLFQIAAWHHWLMHEAHDNGLWTTEILQCDQTAWDVSSELCPWSVHNQFGYGYGH